MNNRNFEKDFAIYCKYDKSSESFSKQPTQLIVQLNSSLLHIIVKITLTVWCITSDELIHRSCAFLACETFLMVDMSRRFYLFSLENLTEKKSHLLFFRSTYVMLGTPIIDKILCMKNADTQW